MKMLDRRSVLLFSINIFPQRSICPAECERSSHYIGSLSAFPLIANLVGNHNREFASGFDSTISEFTFVLKVASHKVLGLL